MTTSRPRRLALMSPPDRAALALLSALVSSCTSAREARPGACAVVSGGSPPCAAGFVRYACAGASRPDEDADFVGGVPRGLICTDMGRADGGGGEDYCCTADVTPCAYDPVAICPAAGTGYQCRGADRPEAFDPTLVCGEGLREGDLVDYCCAASAPAQGCSQVAGHACPTSLVGWTCRDTSLPSEAELGANQSRADFTFLVCSVPTLSTSDTGAVRQYCCFTPTGAPAGASCVQDTTVPGCPPDAFGFACTGTDTPDQDYPAVRCAGAVRGTSPQGFAAALYCCRYQGSVDGG